MAVLMLLEATAKPECVSELKSFMKERLPETRAFEGCQGLTPYLEVDDGRTIVVVERWDSKEAHQKYMAWRAESGVRAQLSSLLEGPPTIRYFEAIDA
jgi:quinol monooxygenase YgiN